MDRKCSFVPFCKEHCRWKSRAALIIWHCRATVPCFALSFRLVRVCVGARGGIYRSRMSCECRPTGAERKVLEMVSPHRKQTLVSLLEEGLVTASPGLLISVVMLGTCGRQVMWAYQVSLPLWSRARYDGRSLEMSRGKPSRYSPSIMSSLSPLVIPPRSNLSEKYPL